MMQDTVITNLIFGGALALGSSTIMAQTFGVEYTTEWQTDFKGSYDWLNMLKTTAEIPVCSGLRFEASTISTAKTSETTLIEDLLTYSNIEAGNIPLTLARMGFGVSAGNVDVFVGLNNVNEDYFTTDLTSLFTNSSCGISPTISCNYDIANYPLSSWCVHYGQHLGDFDVQTSLYPGQGYYRLAGHENLFSLNLRRDGIFSISSIDYKRNGLYTVLGVALHYGMCMGDVDGEQSDTPESASKRLSASPWLLSEISLPYNLELLVHGSLSTVKRGCKDYIGLGIAYSGARVQPGVSFNHATFTDTNEYDLEFCARIPLTSDRIVLQPALHIISTNHASPQCVGLLRCIIR